MSATVTEITAEQLADAVLTRLSDLEIVDVREVLEFMEIRVRGSKNLPLSLLTGDTRDIDWSKEVVFVCRSGARSGRTALAFLELGKSSKNLV